MFMILPNTSDAASVMFYISLDASLLCNCKGFEGFRLIKFSSTTTTNKQKKISPELLISTPEISSQNLKELWAIRYE